MDILLKKICEDLDPIIGETLFSDSRQEIMGQNIYYKNWELLHDPAGIALHWQEIRQMLQ